MATALDVVSAAQKLGLRFVKNGPGDERIFCCPFGCDDDSRPNEGHFYINARTTTCYCHKCGWEGNLLTLYTELKKVDRRTARRELGVEDEPFRPAVPRRSADIAPVEHRDRVYRTLLGILNLDAEHKSDLLRRGLDESVIFKRGYRSVPQDPPLRWKAARFLLQRCGSLEGVPGFYLREGKKGPYWDFLSPKGYFIPVRDHQGKIQALKIRLDSGGYVWFSSEGRPGGSSSGSPLHYTGGKGKVCVTEGPLKADVAHHLSGLPFVGAGGVHATKDVPELLKLLGASDVLVAFDADQFTNQNVRRALQDFLQELKRCGFRAQSLSWPRNLGKGIDDVLLRLYKREVTSVTFLVDGVPVTIKRTVTLEVAIGGVTK